MPIAAAVRALASGAILARATSPKWLDVVRKARVNVPVTNLLPGGVIAVPPSFH